MVAELEDPYILVHEKSYLRWLNIGFLLLAAILVWRFVTTGSIDMLRMMNGPTRGDEAHHHVR